MKFEIPGRLPGMNDIIEAAKKGRGKYQPYNIMKEQYTETIMWHAKKLPKFGKVNISITWYEKDARRDIDNIMGGQKFIMDSLVKIGTIKDDSQKYVKSINHQFEIDRKNPRIEILVEEVESSAHAD
jgi:Holliday junction resolvase RusA-like endonuclease